MNASIPHIAIKESRLWAPTYKAVFVLQLEFMNELLVPGGCDVVGNYDCQMSLALTAGDAAELLERFLSEVLTLSQVQHALFCYVYFPELTDTGLMAQLYGQWISCFENDITGISCTGIPLIAGNGLWKSEVYFEV